MVGKGGLKRGRVQESEVGEWGGVFGLYRPFLQRKTETFKQFN